jgi:hypothetical protein
MGINVGDEVVCIFPGDGTGPDCKVGNKFIVLNITNIIYYGKEKGRALVFSCHPYADGNIIHPSAKAWRFAKAKDIDTFTKVHTKSIIKEGEKG